MTKFFLSATIAVLLSGASSGANLTRTDIPETSTPLYMAVSLVSNKPEIKFYKSEKDVPGGVQSEHYKTDWLLLTYIPTGVNVRADGRAAFRVTKPYYCAVYETTQQQWEHVIGRKLLSAFRPSRFNNKKYWQMRPVESVNWFLVRGNTSSSAECDPYNREVDKFSFMGMLREQAGGKIAFDLPTEAQWEYACRSTSTTSWGNGGNDKNEIDKLGRYAYNGGMAKGDPTIHHLGLKDPAPNVGPEEGTAIVGSYAPNAWGIFDMHGNVNEWCLDWNSAQPAFMNGGDDPMGAETGNCKVCRGGGWWNFSYGDAHACKAESRSFAGLIAAGTPHSAVGFRVVCPIPKK